MSNQEHQIASQILSQFEAARQAADDALGAALLQKIGPEAFASLDSAYSRGRDGDSEALSTAFNVAQSILRKHTIPTPVVQPEGPLEAFSEAGKKAVLDLGRTMALREKQFENLVSPSPQAEADIRTLENRQAVADRFAAERFKGHDTASTLGAMAPYFATGAGAGLGLFGNVVSGAALGTLQPNMDPMAGALLGGLSGGLGYGIPAGGSKVFGAATRNLREKRLSSTPELAQARSQMARFGLEDVTTKVPVTPEQAAARPILTKMLGTEDLSARGLQGARERVGKKIGDHYRESDIPLPDSLDNDLDNIVKGIASEYPIPPAMLHKQTEIFDTVSDTNNPNRGQHLHNIRQSLTKLSGRAENHSVQEGYEQLKQYIDDLALTGLPEGDAAVLKGLQRQFGLIADVQKKNVIDSATGEISLNKLQSVAEMPTHMRSRPELYDMTTTLRAAREAYDKAYARSSGDFPYLSSAGRAVGGYSIWPFVERAKAMGRAIRAQPVSQFSRSIGGGLGLGALPNITNEY